MRVFRDWCVFVACVLAGAGCSNDFEVTLSLDSTTTPGSSGVTVPIRATSRDAPGGVALALSAVPSSISVTPATATLADGDARVYALVPYGTAGTVVASAAFATTASVDVAAAPLVLCLAPPSPAGGGSDLTDAGKVFEVSVGVKTNGDCKTGKPAPSGISVVLSVSQNGASPVAQTAQTDGSGIAVANVLVPWSTEVFMQAAAGGGSASAVISGAPNPASITCMGWQQSPTNVFKIVAKVTNGDAALPSMKVSYTITSSAATVSAPAPASTLTDASGLATTYVSLANAAGLPVVVEATSGNSASTVVLTADASNGSCF